MTYQDSSLRSEPESGAESGAHARSTLNVPARPVRSTTTRPTVDDSDLANTLNAIGCAVIVPWLPLNWARTDYTGRADEPAPDEGRNRDPERTARP